MPITLTTSKRLYSDSGQSLPKLVYILTAELEVGVKVIASVWIMIEVRITAVSELTVTDNLTPSP